MNLRALMIAGLLAALAPGIAPLAIAKMPAMAGMEVGHSVAGRPGGQLPWGTVRKTLAASEHEGHVSGQTVRFYGQAVALRVVANAPRHPDMSFEVGGLTNPTISVARGSRITLTFLNMDYGPGMSHAVLITSAQPPYPPRLNLHRMRVLARIPPLAPRSKRHLNKARYAEASVRFIAQTPGTYYYVCPIPGHALAFHMYGQFIVRNDR